MVGGGDGNGWNLQLHKEKPISTVGSAATTPLWGKPDLKRAFPVHSYMMIRDLQHL